VVIHPGLIRAEAREEEEEEGEITETTGYEPFESS